MGDLRTCVLGHDNYHFSSFKSEKFSYYPLKLDAKPVGENGNGCLSCVMAFLRNGPGKAASLATKNFRSQPLFLGLKINPALGMTLINTTPLAN